MTGSGTRDKKQTHLTCKLLALLLAATNACVGTETGNPSFTGQLSYNTYSSLPQAVSLREPTDGITVERAWLVLGDVRFVSAERCASPASAPVHAAGLGAGDHASPVAPSTSMFIESGSYCSVRLPVELAGAGDVLGAPEALRGHSLLLDVTLADGTPARILSAFVGELVIEAVEGTFEVRPEQGSLLLGFDVAVWLQDIGLQNAQRRDGRILVSVNENTAVLDAFEARLSAGTGLFVDAATEGQIGASTRLIAVGR